MFNLKKSAFTLVELIVVIVILAILATIAFLSFSSQSASARDSTRLSDMSNITKGLSVFNATSGIYPVPDGAVTISASGITIGKQGYAGSSVLNMIKISNGGKDPLDNSTYYTYSTNAIQNKFQILGFLEDGSSSALSLSPDFAKSGLKSVFADPSSYSGRYVMTKGDGIGILLDNITMVPVQATNSPVDIIKTNSGSVYKAVFANESSGNITVASGTVLLSNLVNRNTELIKDKALSALDDSLVGYWDMETLSGVKLKDFSKYGNDGSCYNSGIIVDCNTKGQGPQIVDGDGKTGKAMNFDGIDDSILIPGTIKSFGIGDFSIILKFKNSMMPNSWYDTIISPGNGDNSPKWEENWAIVKDGESQPSYRQSVLEFAIGKGIGNLYDSVTTQKKYNYDNYVNFGFIADRDSFLKIFYNGGLENSKNINININNIQNSQGIAIGRNNNISPGFSYLGQIDEIRLYNRALSNSEIASLYNSTK